MWLTIFSSSLKKRAKGDRRPNDTFPPREGFFALGVLACSLGSGEQKDKHRLGVMDDEESDDTDDEDDWFQLQH